MDQISKCSQGWGRERERVRTALEHWKFGFGLQHRTEQSKKNITSRVKFLMEYLNNKRFFCFGNEFPDREFQETRSERVDDDGSYLSLGGY